MKNNILLDGVNYQCIEKNENFTINGNVLIYIVNNDFELLNFEINDSSSLEIVNFSENKFNGKININMHNNSVFNYVSNIDVKNEYNLKISLNMLGNNSKSDIKINGVVSGNACISVDSFDDVNTIDNIIDESIRILNNGGLVHVEPILRVGSRNVIANHSNSITNIDESYLFYLKTKGITEEKAKELIINSYKYGLVSKYEDVIKNIKR